jgi:hypothetical protein
MRRVTGAILPPLHELELAPRRKGFRVAPPSWPGTAHAEAPVFRNDASWVAETQLETDNPFDAMYWQQAIC